MRITQFKNIFLCVNISINEFGTVVSVQMPEELCTGCDMGTYCISNRCCKEINGGGIEISAGGSLVYQEVLVIRSYISNLCCSGTKGLGKLVAV